ncbi:aerobic respiration two-component sensor histidine kinase ArcB [Gayadomonas joobiniege]|uniref:aerobic respiration two-component sensor histidine kinase ArcB n=1 Tax=Gayadomonas joobiniege TaxID=1234606 RepID=UPI000372D512|nr:aerobic respiration two-component sensor histidine kinase ArcB [Gayadomonas joobiniege]
MLKKSAKLSWPERVARMVNRFGTVRVSLVILALGMSLTIAEVTILNYLLYGQIDIRDYVDPVLLTLLTMPWVLYFISELVRRLERSREHLTQVIDQLEALRKQDKASALNLRQNIQKLNFEIEERKRAELQREEAIRLLKQQIEERQKTQQNLYDQSVLLRSCFDCSPDIIYYRDESGRFSGCNRSFEELTGKTEEEMVGLTPWEVYSEEIAEKVVASDREVLATNASLTYDMWLTYPNGDKKLFLIKKVPFFNQEGKRIGLLGFGRDIMEKQKAQEALEKASRDKTSFISTISHELRTPLNGIVGISRILKDSKLTAEQHNHVNTIFACAVTLGNIFNDIIDLDKIERKKLTINPEPVELSGFAFELNSVASLMAEQKHLNFNFSSNIPEQTWVSADPTRLRQVLWNLLANAVKFTLKGDVEFNVECHIRNSFAWVDFEIIDSGIGIPEEEIDNIFTMYYQVDREEVRAGTGTGIGLAISKILIDSMGGQIEVHSEINEGSSFSVSLKLDLVEPPQDQITESNVNGLSILLVEDVELNIVVANSILKKLGHSVVVAKSGQQAIDSFKVGKFDIVLLDIQLPDMTGFDVLKQWQDEQLSLPPVVALTANVIKTREDYLNKGLTDVIAKPIKMESVNKVFNRLFEQNNSLETSQQALQTDRASLDDCMSELLDTDFLIQMIDTIGHDQLMQNLALFENLIDEYMMILESNLCAKDKEEIGKQAHKIKGAAASMGLKHMQSIANQIQLTDTPAWWENLDDRVEQLKHAVEADLKELKNWLACAKQ